MAGKVTLCMKIVGNNDEYNGYKQYYLHNRVSNLKVKLMDVLSLFVGAKLQRFLRMKNRNTPLFFQKALDRQFISGQNGDGGHRCVAKKQGPPTSGTTWTGPKGVTVDDVTT